MSTLFTLPTYEINDEIIQVTDVATVKNLAIAAAKSGAKAEIFRVWPAEKQHNAALGILGEEQAAACRQHIQEQIAKENAINAQILAIVESNITDEAKIQALTSLAWPE